MRLHTSMCPQCGEPANGTLERQEELWVPTAAVARGPGHSFYDKLNELLAEAGFDRWVEQRCQVFYAAQGRPGIPPGVYFRMLLIGYFEGLESQRGIAWRCADSNSLKSFLGFGLCVHGHRHHSAYAQACGATTRPTSPLALPEKSAVRTRQSASHA